MEPKRKRKTDTYRLLLIVVTLLLIMNGALSVVLITQKSKLGSSRGEDSGAATYEHHFVMIVEDGNEEFWDSVYQGALAMGTENGAWIERMGEDLGGSYSTIELMQIAIAEQVDGILLEYTDVEGLSEQIDLAESSGIPVVTLLRDATESSRLSHVGISYYNLGQQYAEQILSLTEKKEGTSQVFLLMNATIGDSSRTIVYSTIQEIIASRVESEGKVVLTPIMVNESSAFEAEESIRDIFMDSDNLPDIIVCLDGITSACVYQALIDYNKVGSVEEIAYYAGTSILKGIDKKIIHSTTSVDTEGIGRSAVEALLEYSDSGYASDYYSVDTFTIDSSNVAEYMGGETDEK